MQGDDYYVKKTQAWIEEFVIHHNLCPFAAVPFHADKIDYAVFRGPDLEALADEMIQQCFKLRESSPGEIETAFIIHPDCLLDFGQYLDFAAMMNTLLTKLELENTFQWVTFHPDYIFGDAAPGAPEHFTNRSPFPMFQILRQDSIRKAREEWGPLEKIPARNIKYLKKLGIDELKSWWRTFRKKD